MNVKAFVSVAMAYPAAAACGAAIVALEFAAFALIGDASAGLHEIAAGWWVLPVAWLYGFLGLIIPGTVAGWVLHRVAYGSVAG